ncbi:MAG: glycosyltransferase family 39 protein [Planctomycetes bacterium]|nr:glycosyltransferase family 39 protein [Planctomycetota bacterium]
MSGRSRLLVALLGVVLWAATLPWLGLAQSRAEKWIVFGSGSVLIAIALVRRGEKSPDPGPYQPGIGGPDGRAPLSIGLLLTLTAVAAALRLVTLGQPVEGDDLTWLGIGSAPPESRFLARLPLAVCGALTPAFLYLLVRRATGEPAALLAALLLAVAPAHVSLSQTVDVAAPAVLLFVLSTLALRTAIARDRPIHWWLYGLLLAAAVPLGPWTLTLLIGHGVVVVGWSLLRRLGGYPALPLGNFLVALAVVGACHGLALTRAWRDAGPAHAWTWLPMGTESGAIPAVVWALAGFGLVCALWQRHGAPVVLLVAPAGCAWLLTAVSSPYEALATPPWPILPALVVLAAVGLLALLRAGRALLASAFPGRIPGATAHNLAVILIAVLLGLAIVPGLQRHYHRAGPGPAADGAAPPPAAEPPR